MVEILKLILYAFQVSPDSTKGIKRPNYDGYFPDHARSRKRKRAKTYA